MMKNVCRRWAVWWLAAPFIAVLAQAQTEAHLAGQTISRSPFFKYVRTFNADMTVYVSIDLARFPELAGRTCNLYVVGDKTSAEWVADPSLVDVRGGPQAVTAGTSYTFIIADPWDLPSSAGTTELGVGYDVVLDVDRDGLLSTPDYIDGGWNPDEGGFYVVHDITTLGPLAVTAINYSVTGPPSGYQSERTWYPTGIATMGKLPLIVIGHGNGHSYNWYDYLQQHLASYGYIVMSHQNNTGPGIESASTTTLTHTDAILRSQGTIAGGVLNHHIDENRIIWIGHSRGGEGVVRAYARLIGGYEPDYYTAADIQLVSSIAPTDFLGPASSNPYSVNYHLVYGAADGDVAGYPDNDIADAFNIYERAAGTRCSQYIHGVGHNEFNCCGWSDATGPALIGRPAAQTLAKGYYLALIKHFVEGNVAAKEFLWRQYEDLRPMGALASCGDTDASTCATVVLEYKDGPPAGNYIIDDFQSQPSPTTSSSGGTVTFASVRSIYEGPMNDTDGSFQFSTTDPMNGMTRGRTTDTTRGLVFEVGGNAPPSIEFSVVPAFRDFSQMTYLSFRACQQTRHVYTTTKLGDSYWLVTLRDGSGGSSFPIRFDVYKGGIEEPYQRGGFGAGLGWQNEMETVRIRLTDFQNRATRPVDLSDIVAVRFIWRDNLGNYIGRLALDDIEVTSQE